MPTGNNSTVDGIVMHTLASDAGEPNEALSQGSSPEMQFFTFEGGAMTPALEPPMPSPVPLARGVHRCSVPEFPDYWQVEVWTARRVCLVCAYVLAEQYDEWERLLQSGLDLMDPVSAKPRLRLSSPKRSSAR